MFTNVYYQTDIRIIYLHLDGWLRQVPDRDTFLGLYGEDFDPTKVNQVPSQKELPFAIGNPLLKGASLFKLTTESNTLYLTDIFPWKEQQVTFRKVVNVTQLNKLGFRSRTNVWAGSAPVIDVPLAIDSNQNWHLQAMLDGATNMYAILAFPGHEVNPYFKGWLNHPWNLNQAKAKMTESMQEIANLSGEKPVATPVFTPNGGITRVPNQVVSISCATPNATIYYSLDGSTPVPGISSEYLNPIALPFSSSSNTNITLKAVAQYHDSLGVSAVQSADFVYTPILVDVPTFTPPEEDQKINKIVVSIFCATQGAKIYYTTDGTTPTVNSSLYTGGITVDLKNSTQRIKAIAMVTLDGITGTSGLADIHYRFVPKKLSAPTFLPVETQQVSPSVSVAVIKTDPDCVLRYTTDTNGIPDRQYTVPIRLTLSGTASDSATIFAQATSTEGALPSDIVSQTYTTSVDWEHVWILAKDANDLEGNIELKNTKVTYETLTLGDSAYFSGNAILETSDVTSMSSPICTMSGWAKFLEISNAENYAPVFIFENPASGDDGAGILVYNTGQVVAETIQSNSEYVLVKSSEGLINLNSWNHFVLVADGTNLNLYVNGEVIGSSTYDNTILVENFKRFSIGAEKGGDGAIRHGMKGYINRVYYISTALSAETVSQLYQSELEQIN